MRSLNRICTPAELADYAYHPTVTPEVLEGQHEIRRWEYSQALYALERWEQTPRAKKACNGLTVADIGGAGSKFWQALAGQRTAVIDVVDPEASPAEDGVPVELLSGPLTRACRSTLEEWSNSPTHDMHAVYHAVFCLSVIEHVADPQPFLRQLCSLVSPGGLLVLTLDCAAQAPDTYHFNWMRKWIGTPDTLDRLHTALNIAGFTTLDGDIHFEYSGSTVFDYTVGSLAFVRTT